MTLPSIELGKLLSKSNELAYTALGTENAFRLGNLGDQINRSSLNHGLLDEIVEDITIDSREAKPGMIFVAVRGANVDGHRFVQGVIEKGIAVVVDEVYYEETYGDESAPQTALVVVPDTRNYLPYLAAAFFQTPSHHLNVIGITGTNGKTTTCHVIESLLTRSATDGEGQHRVGVLGTIAHRWPGFSVSSINTTPESLLLQRYFWQMKNASVTDVVMEASSHALAGSRLEEVAFNVMVFTNLTQDHLDFHGTMKAYRDAKARLFSDFLDSAREVGKEPVAILNACDPVGLKFADLAREHGARVFTYGIDDAACDLCATEMSVTKTGTTCTICWSDDFAKFVGWEGKETHCTIETPLIGKFNVFNVLAGILAAVSCGRDFQKVLTVLGQLDQVPGRLQRVGKQFFVDYAHAPDAVESVLKTMQPLFHNRQLHKEQIANLDDDTDHAERLIIVLGAGGDRDKSKRWVMGEIAGRLADHVIVTNDNPRSEDPMVIAEAVAQGARSTKHASVEIILDRKMAITAAVEHAGEHDLVVIAGKGHETYQEIQGVRTSFSDTEVLKHAIKTVEMRG